MALCIVLFAAAHPAVADLPPAPGQTYALLVAGLGGPEPYPHWYDDWIARFQAYLTVNAGIPAANITTLAHNDAAAEAIIGTLGALAKKVKPQDQFILFIVGHGEITGASPTLILPGPDLTADDLAAALAGIASMHQVILNFSASSGDFLSHLASPVRVNIAATSPREAEEPVFAEFFLRGLESKRAGGGKGGAINLLDAYNWAARQTAMWIARFQLIPSDPPATSGSTVWKANGQETVEIFQKLYQYDPSRKLDPSSDGKAADGVVELSPSNGVVTDAWASRRVVDEHATLEDCGETLAVSALGEKGFQPILGQNPGDPGYLAAHTIPGQPAPFIASPDIQTATSGTNAIIPSKSETIQNGAPVASGT